MPLSYEIVINATPAFVATAVGIYVAYLSKKQKDIAEALKNIESQKLRLELLEERLPIYEEVVEILESISASGRLTDDQHKVLSNWSITHAFLFRPEVQEWIGQVRAKAGRRQRLHVMIKDETIPPEHEAQVNAEFWETGEWFTENEGLILEAFQRDMRIEF